MNDYFVHESSYVDDNVVIGKGTKIWHFSHIMSDSKIGENCNIGCGAIFANYNGKIKQKIFVGDNCFIGANVTLVAPLTIKNDCFIGAGTVIRKDLDEISDLKLIKK